MHTRVKSKEELLKNKDAKVVIAVTPEAEAMLELAINADRIYKRMRKNLGFKIEKEKFSEAREEFLDIMDALNGHLENIAKDFEIKFEGSRILKEMIKNS